MMQMVLQNKVRFGLIGTGNAAKIHAKAISKMENAKLVAVVGRNSQKAMAFSNEFQCDTSSSVDELLARKDIDAICITTPSGTHADIGIKAAKAGKHVVVEKPIDVTLKKADAFIKACEKQNVKLAVISQRRYSDGVQQIRRAIKSNKLGKIGFGGMQVRWYRSQEYYDSAQWRGTWELDGGGALINQSIHYVDLLQYLVGPVEEVFGYCKTMAHKIEVEDLVVGSLKFKNGAIGLVESTTAAYPGFFSRVDVYGDNGSAALVNDEAELIITKGENILEKKDMGDKKNSTSGPEISYVLHEKQLRNFVDSILKGVELDVKGEDGRNALAIVEGLYTSCKEKKVIKIDLI